MYLVCLDSTRVTLMLAKKWISIVVLHATDGPAKTSPGTRTICGELCCYGCSPGPSMAAIDGPPDHLWCRKRSPVATDGPPLEMMSHGSYEVDLANMDCVIIIFHYALLDAVARHPSSVDTHTARVYN